MGNRNSGYPMPLLGDRRDDKRAAGVLFFITNDDLETETCPPGILGKLLAQQLDCLERTRASRFFIVNHEYNYSLVDSYGFFASIREPPYSIPKGARRQFMFPARTTGRHGFGGAEGKLQVHGAARFAETLAEYTSADAPPGPA